MLVRRVLYVASERGLTNNQGVPLDKVKKTHYGTVSDALSRARRAGLLPWGAIIDTTERMEPDGFDSPADFRETVNAWAESYRIARQVGQPRYLVGWSEHRGLRAVLSPVAQEFGVPIAFSGGFDSTGGRFAEAERARRRDVPTSVLHFGDRDKAGEDIFDVVADDLQQLSHGCIDEVVRVALTPEQMAAISPTAVTMQVDAAPVPTLRHLFEDAVLARQDPDARQAVLSREPDERAEAVAWVKGWAA